MIIHYIKSGRADLNFGKAVNDTISCFNDHDWICLMDIDTMPSYHEAFYKTVEGVAKSTGYGLIGCMTNRCGMKDQLISGNRDIISHNTDWLHHREIGKALYQEHGYSVKGCKTTIAGLFMLFKKQVWTHVGGFKEGGVSVDGKFVDWHFCNDAINKGYLIGIAQGLYMIHQYRPEAANPRSSTKHLRK